jgi:hypothetical protein
MLESLFAQPPAIARYRSALLLKERLRCLAHFAQIGVKPETLPKIAFNQLNLARILSRVMAIGGSQNSAWIVFSHAETPLLG